EEATASLIEKFLTERHIPAQRYLNNIWCINKFFDPAKPVVLLNSHHDTVKPNPQYTKDPFSPLVEDGRLYGLGSNDAGGALVGLIAAFLYFYEREDLQYNIVLAATAEEEISGANGIEALLHHDAFLQSLKEAALEFAIVGEPTMTNLAVAEKGLLVLDCTAHGRAGHAARNEGENAIYKAMKDIEWFKNVIFVKVFPSLGPVKMSVTVIHTENKAHNVVPAVCSFVVDIRVTDAYTHEEVLDIIRRYVTSDVKPRSMRMRSSKIDMDHPVVRSGLRLGKTSYGSPTTSDQALIPVPSLKCGPGDSARSHTADEYIYLDEVRQGIETYVGLLEGCILE
ncbi:MAG: M20/M25/M40 family metallo-hydrolase, partial [Bacteroidetes bacterium]|nr:M20/M25/M40 family metallo-hydrolase [Bacteroidota bacterium]